MKRAIQIQHNDGTEPKDIEIAKYSSVKTQGGNFFFLEEMKDGKWRLTVSEGLIPDMRKVDFLKMIRED